MMVLLITTAALALGPPSLLAADRFEDPVGDAGGGPGPDIAAVTLSQPATESLSVAIEFATDPPLVVDAQAGFTDMVLVALDTGDPAETPGDADYAIGVHAATLSQGVFLRSRDSRSAESGVGPAAVSGKTLTMTLPLAAIGNPTEFRFQIAAGREGPADQPAGGDAYPDQGWQTYSLAGPTPPSPMWLWAALVLALGGALLVTIALVRRRGRDAGSPPSPSSS